MESSAASAPLLSPSTTSVRRRRSSARTPVLTSINAPLLADQEDSDTSLYQSMDSSVEGSPTSHKLANMEIMSSENPKRKRCCWGYLSGCQLGCLVFFVVSVTSTIVGMAIGMMNESTVDFGKMQVYLDPPPDAFAKFNGNTTVWLHFNGAVDKSTPVRVTAHPARFALQIDATLLPHEKGDPEMWRTTPGPVWVSVGILHAPRNTFEPAPRLLLNMTAAFEVTEMDLFGRYNQIQVAQDTVPWRSTGPLSVTVHLWWIFKFTYTVRCPLPYRSRVNRIQDLPVKKEVTVPGFQGLQNVTLNNFQLPRNSPLGGVELFASSTVFNPVDITMAMPSFTLDVLYLNKAGHVATVTNPANTLTPGLNTINVSGRVNPSQAGDDMMQPMLSKFAQGHAVNTTVCCGRLVDPNGPAWLNAVLGRMWVTVPIQATLNLNVVKNIDVKTVRVFFNKDGEPVVAANVTSLFESPYGFPLQVLSVQIKVMMLPLGPYNLEKKDYVAVMEVPRMKVDSQMGSPSVTVKFKQAVCVVKSQSGFNDLVTAMINESTVVVASDVLVSVEIDSAMHRQTVDGIFIANITVPVQGLDGFRSVTVTNGNLTNAVGPALTKLDVTSWTLLGNPANIIAHTGHLRVDVIYMCKLLSKTVVVGMAEVEDAALELGISKMIAGAFLERTDVNKDCLKEFIQRYMLKDPEIQVGARGRKDSTKIKILQPVISTMELLLHFVAPPYRFIESVVVQVYPWKIVTGHLLTAYVVAFNPVPVTLHLPGMGVNVYDKKGRLIYTMVISDKDEPLPVPFGSNLLEINVPASGIKWDAFKDALGVLEDQEIHVKLDGPVTFTVQPSFRQTINFYAEDVLAKVYVHLLSEDELAPNNTTKV